MHHTVNVTRTVIGVTIANRNTFTIRIGPKLGYPVAQVALGHILFFFWKTDYAQRANIFLFFSWRTPSKGEDGGGFIFDCRCLPNPGLLESFKYKTGNDMEVGQFMMGQIETEHFAETCWALILATICNYQKKGYTRMNVAFGCTGGQHRSVFMANMIKCKAEARFPEVRTEVTHINESAWPSPPVPPTQ